MHALDTAVSFPFSTPRHILRESLCARMESGIMTLEATGANVNSHSMLRPQLT